MAISPDEIAQVRTATDLVALISEQVALKRSGRNWVGLCPFHSEKTGSFNVRPDIGRYNCFGCGVGGDAITWIRETQRMEFIDAVRFLAERAGITLHEEASSGPAKKDRQEFLDAMAKAVDWYHERLLNGPDAGRARAYLKSRGITGEVARQFKLGWAPDDWDALVSGLNLSPKVLEGTGLGFVNKNNRRQDFLRARIVFPIFDPTGKAIAIGGRILPPPPDAPEPERREAKYKNSPETPIYSKRRTLYALNWAKDDIIRSGEIIVCEGYTDVIAFFGAGLPRAVATCGTALADDHFKTMKNFAKRIVLAYDADSAGQKAAASVYQWERQYDVDVAVAAFPKGMDPAELAQKDPDALRQAIADAIPFLEFRLRRAIEGANTQTPEGRARAAEAAIAVLAEHPNELVRDQYVMTLADQLRIEAAVVRQRVANYKAPVSFEREIPNEPPVERFVFDIDSTPRPGLEALRLFLQGDESVRSRLAPALFINEHQRQAFEGMASGRAVADVIDELEARDARGAAQLVNRLVLEQDTAQTQPDAIAAVIAQLLRAAVAEGLRELERQLKEGVVAPAVAMATITDVKERVALLDSAHGEVAEADLRQWLVERDSGQ